MFDLAVVSENDKVLYAQKNAFLVECGGELTEPTAFYRDIFPEGSFERTGHPEDNKANGVFIIVKEKGAIKRILTDSLCELDDALGDKFSVMSPVSYFGRSRKGHYASELFAFTVDLDGVGMSQLRNLLHQCNNKILPYPTYIVNSGTGLHLYYVLYEPLPLYPQAQRTLKDIKYALIRQCWNLYTSNIEKPQMQGIMQGFRMVGCRSKLGAEYPVVAYKFGDKLDLMQLMPFLPERERIELSELDYQSKLPLKKAAELYPEWYERRIKRQEPKGRWHIKRDLYDWWLRRLPSEAKYGHRYFCIMCLAIYAKKCDIDEDELRSDALALIPQLDTNNEHPFSEDDVIKALEVYNESYCTFPRKDIEKISGIVIPPNKRNGRKQEQHMAVMRAIQGIVNPDWRNKDGRPVGSNKRQLVAEWQQAYPEGSKSECKADTGLTYPTIRKWWGKGLEE